jgi:hypothetical protein
VAKSQAVPKPSVCSQYRAKTLSVTFVDVYTSYWRIQ